MANLEKFFALSTCIHCKRTREFFEEQGVPCSPIYIDNLDDDARDEVVEEMRRYNPNVSFPTLVFSDGAVIVGFQRDRIAEELGL